MWGKGLRWIPWHPDWAPSPEYVSWTLGHKANLSPSLPFSLSLSFPPLSLPLSVFLSLKLRMVHAVEYSVASGIHDRCSNDKHDHIEITGEPLIRWLPLPLLSTVTV